MKAFIKSGLCFALGWLASAAGAQEAPIKWQPSAAKNSRPSAVIYSVAEAAAKSEAQLRPVVLSQPIPLDDTGNPAFRLVSEPFTPTVRGQAADEKTVPAVPILEVGPTDQKPPKKMPTEGFTPPAPQTAPSPIFGNLGIMPDECCNSDCGLSWCGRGSCEGVACRPDRSRCFWVSAEYLMWWQRSQSVPPLVTVSPAGTATGMSGVLGQDATRILYDSTPDHTRSGGRFAVGMWMPHFCNLGIEANYFFLGRQTSTATYGSNGDPQVSRPVFNAITQKPAAEIVSINNANTFVTGTVSVNNFSQVWGAEANVRSRLSCGPCYWVDILVGYRHLNLSEGIDITENLQNFDPRTRLPAGNFLVHDSFHTRNQFNGVQVGLDGERRFWDRCFVGMTTKLAMGNVHQIVNIDGSTTFTNFPAPFGGTFPGGLLALPGTNIGRFTANRFGVLPEVGFKLGYDITDHLRVFVGYDFLYLTSVVRPGEQIDLRVNPNFVPSAAGPGPGGGPRLPAVLFHTNDYWAQGLNFGLQYRY